MINPLKHKITNKTMTIIFWMFILYTASNTCKNFTLCDTFPKFPALLCFHFLILKEDFNVQMYIMKHYKHHNISKYLKKHRIILKYMFFKDFISHQGMLLEFKLRLFLITLYGTYTFYTKIKNHTLFIFILR